MQEVSLTLEPRSACGFFLYQYAAYLNATAQWPMTVYHNGYKAVKYTEVEYMKKTGNRTGTSIEVSCFEEECNNYFYITYG